MFKITIDNEEVITDKDFTIEEEMLNTPSVILNNVYPKEWEQDKDYLNFYHPNEYSKCKIYDEEITPASEGSTVEGTDFSITYDDTKEFNLLSLKGDTSQSGTPTPTAPIPVDTVTGRQDILVAGKNLFDGAFRQGNSSTANNTTRIYSKNAIYLNTGTYTISTDMNTSSYKYAINLATKTFPIQVGNIYYDSGWKTSASFTFTVSSAGYFGMVVATSNGSGTIVPEDMSSFHFQLESGSPATTFTDNAKIYEINLGKNMYDISLVQPGYINTTGGISGSHPNDEGYVRYIPCEPNTSYVFDIIETPTSFQQWIGIAEYSGQTESSFLRNSVRGTVNVPCYFTTGANTNYLCVSARNTLNATKVQLEKGGITTSYSPYKTPIELCKIGNYQDYIFKNTPDSDYYDNTLEEGAWYLHKEIGKKVVDGTENWQYISVAQGSLFRSNNAITNAIVNTTFVPYSNNYKGIAFNVSQQRQNNQFYINYNLDYLDIIDNRYTSANDYKTWLGTAKPSFYYAIETPTTELIEDTELLGQLEEINLLNGLNNISVTSPYLTTPIKIHYNFNEEIINQDLYFCGVVKNSGNISLNPREPHFQSLQVLSYKTFLSEGETLDFVIYQKTIREAIEQVVSAIQDYGFIVGDINILNPDEIIGAYSTKDKSAYDVFQYIADITQSRWTTRMIDEDTIAIDFYDPSLMQLGTTLDYTQEFFENNLIDDMSYSYGTNDYRNKQVMTSQEVYSNINQIQNIVANGYQTQFNTEQQIGKINSIKISGVDYTFATNTEKDMGVIADFYYSAGNNYFESASTISIGTVIVIDYLPIVEGRQIITNSNEIDRVANSTGVKGVVARYENRNDATTSTELQLIGQSYIKYKGVPEIVLTVITRKNIWEVGQRVQFNAPINELATLYMVRKKSIHRITTIDTIFYTFELVSSFNSETAVNYFDNQRAKANGNIGEGEYISRNIDIQSTANIIFYDTQANEITVVGDNELNCTLESPFVS